MSRKRHHYVPRFLLARFASKRQEEKSWVWQISTDRAIEISTKDAAVSKHFYGQDSSIEDALVPLETGYAATLSKIDAGEPPEAHREQLRGLLWTLVVRGKSVRDQFARFVPEMVRNAISSLDSEAAQRALHANVSLQDDELDDMLATIPPELRPLAAVFDSPEVRTLIRALAANLIDEGGLATMVRSMFDHSRLEAMAQTAARGGQLSGMSNMVAQGVTPRTFDPRVWEVVRFPSGGLVLGDTCVIAVDEAGTAGSMLRMSDRWCASYLPISPTTALVAWRGEPGRPLNEHAIALASWELAEDYVYADRELPTVRHTAPPHSFGSRSEVMTDDELQALFANEWHDAAKR